MHAKRIPLNDTASKDQFHHEVKICSILKSKYIVTIHDWYIKDRFGYIFMDLLHCDLLEYLPNCVNNEKIIKKIFTQIVHAIKHCHVHKIAHLDIKLEKYFT